MKKIAQNLDYTTNLLTDALSRSDIYTIQNLIENFHHSIKRLQEIQSKEIQQLVNPEFQERFIRFKGVFSPRTADSELLQFMESINGIGVSDHQKVQLRDVQQEYYGILLNVYKDRDEIFNSIKDYYCEKTINDTVDNNSIAMNLELLKRNIEIEAQIFNETIDKVGNILDPMQEANLILNYQNINRDKLNVFNLLNIIWKSYDNNI